ncbi:helix-hairpin-helix domain-containing protein [Levilactobacillus bambusae]|uniref:Competence protein ComEA n=1 Tax=Levilactobacillus bambusae TaxID=2024736 RepID=A0A2V1N0B6_9LACO|nr:helix-hairpin-helix domain-containing protein [Levilactobacillus bambusae]PWG00677.1 competence protein ComEA [Levilactobacillus bambusae]
MERLRQLIGIHLRWVITGGIIGVIALIIGIMTLNRGHSDQATPEFTSQQVGELNSDKTSGSSFPAASEAHQSGDIGPSSGRVFVDVKGAVKHPGLYEVRDDMRVMDAIQLAGGCTRSADQKHLNLAQRLTDQQVVYVPIKGEVKGPPAGQQNTADTKPSSVSSSTASQSGQTSSGSGATVNLNQATKEQLMTINGVGDKKADKIIEYRQQHGSFKSVDDLKDVPGFGEKTVANLRSHLSV